MGRPPTKGSINAGTVFKITPSGVLTTIYNFCSQSDCTDGVTPFGALVQATNGDLYGTTDAGGSSAFVSGGAGTVFKITPGGLLTTIHTFCSQSACTDQAHPLAGLVQATNGDLYGTTSGGIATAAQTRPTRTDEKALPARPRFSEGRMLGCVTDVADYTGLPAVYFS
jgi:uncharacterized repeat protein (TIGR03803 family)